MCVVTVDDGPGQVRWGLVAVTLDSSQGAAPARRHRLRSTNEVLAVVAQFLLDAGLDEPPPAGADPRKRPWP
jgi:hypothetical protein